MSDSKRVLISTIQPAGGGVPVMVKAVVDYLRQRHYTITLAFYEPYSLSPKCSVPLHKLIFNKPSIKTNTFYDCPCVGIGCYLPELEFTHYQSSAHWQTLIDQHDVHLTVSGSCLAALPFIQSSTPFLAWIASDWQGDRAHRVKTFPWYRRFIDQTLITLMTKHYEKKIVASGRLLALSDHTQTMLNRRVNANAVRHVLPMPIDTLRFAPAINSSLAKALESIQSQRNASSSSSSEPSKSTPHRIGFIGRFEDPRKNITLLLNAFAQALGNHNKLELLLIGDSLSPRTTQLAKDIGVFDRIRVHSYLEGEDLLRQIRSLDIFVLPSHQEGLCIAALEAMSCGIPVVSTRCGGPETFVHHGENGLLVDSTPQSMSDAIVQLLSDEADRLRYAKNARDTVVQQFSKQVLANKFWALFDQSFIS